MDDAHPTRRRTLKLMAGATGALAMGSVMPLSGCGGGGRAAPEAETRLSIADLAVGGRLKIDHHGEPVEVSRLVDGVTARSLICTHEYCETFWHAASGAYRCPCHAGRFAADGSPLAGPVSRPMWSLPVRVDDDTIIVGGAA